MKLRLDIPFALLCITNMQAQDADAVRATARKYVKSLTSPALHGRGYVN